jgi:hypothetical protein
LSNGIRIISSTDFTKQKSAFINNNNQLISIWFDKIVDFNEGLAKVCLNGKYGFVNQKGQLLIDTYFLNASNFKNEKALVQIDKYGEYFNEDYFAYFINEQGVFVNYYNGKALGSLGLYDF